MSRSLTRSARRRRMIREVYERERALEQEDVQGYVYPHTLIPGVTLRSVWTTYRGRFPTRAAVLIYRAENRLLTPSVGTDTV
jgi:hypothetical protein